MPFDPTTARPLDFDPESAKPVEEESTNRAKNRPWWQEIPRQAGLTARYAVEGVTALPNIVGDVLGMQSSKAVSDLLTRIGLPLPEGTTERLVGAGARGMAGTVPFVGLGGALSQAASPVARGIGSTLRSTPGLQAASGLTGGVSGQAAAEAGAGTIGQTLAALVGGALPFGGSAAAGGIRAALAGGEASRQAGRERISQFGAAGTSPSVAQAFQTHTGQAGEAFLTRDPGGHGVMVDFAKKQAEEVGKRTDELVGVLSGKTSPMIAGRAIEEGITGSYGFLDKFKTVSRELYNKLDSFLPPKQEVPVNNLINSLEKLTRPAEGAEELSKTLMNAKVLELGRATAKDLAGKPPTDTITILGSDGKPISTVNIGGSPGKNTIPYEALKDVRSRIGEMIADSNLVSDIPRRQLKQLYSALSKDMQTAVFSTGSKDAINIFNRANAYTRAGHQRIDEILQPIIDKTTPEKMFSAAMSGSKEGDSMIHGVMQSLPEKQQRVLAATILKKMGYAIPSKQGAEGTTFSVDTYLSNWAKMSPESKRSLFSRWGENFVSDLNTVAKTAENIRKGGEVYGNPSGTGAALNLQHTVSGAVLLAMFGHIPAAAAIIGEQAVSNASARLFTNPTFVKWLAQSTRLPEAMLPSALNVLQQRAAANGDDDLVKLSKTISDAFTNH